MPDLTPSPKPLMCLKCCMGGMQGCVPKGLGVKDQEFQNMVSLFDLLITLFLLLAGLGPSMFPNPLEPVSPTFGN